jgi:hypothetical protein
MTRIINIQTNFTVGEIDPLLRGRIDLAQYYSGLKTARNVVVLPQGGVRRRPGLKFIHDLPSNASDGVVLVPFEFSTSDAYMFAIVNQRVYIYKAGVLVTNINGSGNDYLAATELTSARLANLNYAQSADTVIFVHKDMPVQKMVRGATDADWTISSLSFDYTPKYAFTITLATPAATLTPSATTGTVTLTASAAVFSAPLVDQYINNKVSYGRARVIEFVSTTVVRAVVEIPFSSTTAIAASSWETESGYENVWSNTRGYPRSVTFHEGRLYFGGSRDKPSTVWGSRVGDFFNFDKQTSLDDDAVEATLDVNNFNAIVNIYSGRDLQLFTTGGEFYVPQGLGDPITPGTFLVRIATRNGSIEGTRPVGLEAGTIYIQRGGKMVQEFIYTDTQASYVSNKISLLSGHLINTPIDMAMRRATDTDESDLLMLVNTDGTFTAYSVLRSADIIAPSTFDTDGLFKAVAVDISTIYVVVQRTINSVVKYHVETFSNDFTLDNAVSGGAAANVTATNFAAKTVKVITDGVVLGDEVASSGGLVTFDRSSVTSYQVGQDYTVTIATMPIEPRLQVGNMRGFKKRIIEVEAEFYETQNASVNSVEVPFRAFDSAVLDTAVAEFTGLKRVGPLLGYDYEGSVTVTQTQPLKMTLLFLDYRLSVNMGQ